MTDKSFDKWLVDNVEFFNSYYKNKQKTLEEHSISACLKSALSEKPQKHKSVYDDPCFSEPELLHNMGQFNPALYFLMLWEDDDILIFKEIEDNAVGTKLILFTAGLAQTFEIMKDYLALVQHTKIAGEDLAKVTTDVFVGDTSFAPMSRKPSKIGVGIGTAKVSYRLYQIGTLSEPAAKKNTRTMIELAQASLKLNPGLKQKLIDKIELRIRDLQIKRDVKENSLFWMINQRNEVVAKYWKDYLKMLGG